MFKTKEEIEALLGIEAESASLEFKAGPALVGLGQDREKRREFIKDVTAFANAGGGTILYGVGQQDVNGIGIGIASAIVPVPAGEVTPDRLAQIVHANTDPPLRGFRARPVTVEGGQIIVVEVEEGDTATQNRLDFLFYQRVEATTSRMSGYAVRDVMNRRRVPRLDAAVVVRDAGSGETRHNYRLEPRLRNVGTVTAAHWRFIIEVPPPLHISPDTGGVMLRVPLAGVSLEGQDFSRWEYSSERGPATRSMRLLPGEEINIVRNQGFPDFVVQIDAAEGRRLVTSRPLLRWVVHVDNAEPMRGALAYDVWCRW